MVVGVRPDYPLKTARLVLRPYEAGDFDDFYACRSQPEVYRYLFADNPDRAEAEELLAKKMAQTELTEEGQRLSLAAYWPEAGRVVGDVCLKWQSEQHRQGEIGYVFNPEFHGKGLAREAAAEMLKLGFEDLNLHRIVAECDPRNEPSWRLMERLGMRREAHFRDNEIYQGEWCGAFIYALLEEEYRRAQA
jgi:RimJ/RimL family protein N-acetyltransferase